MDIGIIIALVAASAGISYYLTKNKYQRIAAIAAKLTTGDISGVCLKRPNGEDNIFFYCKKDDEYISIVHISEKKTKAQVLLSEINDISRDRSFHYYGTFEELDMSREKFFGDDNYIIQF